MPTAVPHLPQQAAVEAYGQGGFRFAGMSHRGSLLFLPSGVYAWSVPSAANLDEDALAPVFAEAEAIEILVLGTGRAPIAVPQPLRERCRELRIAVEPGPTGTAVRIYNILFDERRRVAAALIAVD